jgi:hypothetical protein
MGEAKRRREAKAAREAAYRLGGEEALKQLIEPGETVDCPMCDWQGLLPAGPGAPEGAKVTCFLCKGKGGLMRFLRAAPVALDLEAFIPQKPAVDALACCPRPRRY